MALERPEDTIEYLEGKIAALEDELRRRSLQLRRLQRLLCPDDLLQLDRIANDLPPLPRRAYDIEMWTETTETTPADVEETLHDLWRSVAVPEDDDA